jgi:hypothetical protein
LSRHAIMLLGAGKADCTATHPALSPGHAALHGPHSDHALKPPSTTTRHACTLHPREVCSRAGSHAAPPNRGGVQVRVALCTPPPQDREQGPKADQGP